MDPMTPDQPQFPPVDPGNHLLGPCPAVLTTSPVNTPDGQKLALTVRTNSTTLTVLLDALDVGAWADQLARDKSRMAGSKLVAAQAMPPGSLAKP